MLNRKNIGIGLILIVVVSSVLYFYVPSRSNVNTKTVKKHDNQLDSIGTKSVDELKENDELKSVYRNVKNDTFFVKMRFKQCTPVRFKIDGKLDKPMYNWTVGDKVMENDLVYALNNERAFKNVSVEKQRLKERIESMLLQDLQISEEDEKILDNFKTQISETDFLPVLSTSNQLTTLLKKEGVLNQMNAIYQLENEMFLYFFLSPFDGYIVATHATHKDRNVAKNEAIALLSKKNRVVIEVELPQEISNASSWTIQQHDIVLLHSENSSDKYQKNQRFEVTMQQLKKINPFEKALLIVRN